jgi:hypothetical protein
MSFCSQASQSQPKFVLLKASVRPSHRTNEEEHEVWFCVTTDGTIKIAGSLVLLGKEALAVTARLFSKLKFARRQAIVGMTCTNNVNFCNHGTERNIVPGWQLINLRSSSKVPR